MKTINLSDPNNVPAEDAIKLHEIAKVIFKARKSSLLTGAGISCNAGIPDFRSDEGLYNIVKAKYPTSFIKGQDLFDISLFRNNTTLSIFCTFMEGLYKHSLQAKATETHRFIKTLKDKNKLLRCYTQNIDSLEKTINLECGIDSSKFNEIENSSGKSFRENWNSLDVVQLHGNLHKLSCTQCYSHYDWTPQTQRMLKDGENPECENCYLKYQERLYSGKRLTGSIGILRPDIVLYGENHPQSEILARGLNVDIGMKCDCLLIMGTSLKVDGVKKLVRSLSKNIRDRGGKVIFVNKTPLSKQWAHMVDYQVLGDCDAFVRVLKTEIPDLFLTQEQLDSKKLNAKNSSATIKREMTKKFVDAIKQEIKQEIKSEDVLTPPSTPSKNRTVLLPQKSKKRPTLKRNDTKSIKKKCPADLPSPESSFAESIKIESESDVATDCDEDTLLESFNLKTRRKCFQRESGYEGKRIKIE